MSKPGILTWIDENWQSIECQFYGGIQAGAMNAAFGSVFTGKIPLALGLGAISYAAGKTAEMAGCNYQPPEPDNPALLAGCQKFGEGDGILYYNRADFEAPGFAVAYNVAEVTKIDEKYLSGQDKWAWEVFYKTSPRQDGSVYEGSYYYIKEGTRFPVATLTPNEGAVCGVPAPEPEPPVHNPGNPISDPITHTDGDCNWTIQATDAYVDDQGVWHTYYSITADNDACGGPFAYWSSGNGPEYVSPKPDPTDDPDNPTVDPTPYPPPSYDPRFDDIEEKLDELKDCACPEKPVQKGDYRTISFRSDETSPFGKSRLRKRFKYRSQSGLDLGAVVNHWRDFEFAAGPVAVGHVGSALGSPQVWAATADEGKRVIRHAGGEAGIDPDQVGEWRIGGSDNSRYGVSGQMRVDTTGGYYWITARDGSDARPIVAKT